MGTAQERTLEGNVWADVEGAYGWQECCEKGINQLVIFCGKLGLSPGQQEWRYNKRGRRGLWCQCCCLL